MGNHRHPGVDARAARGGALRAGASTWPDLFEAQVRRTPDAMAVAFGAETLDYASFNRRANRVAHALQARGIGPDALVALCAERGIDMLVGVMGILKAGAAYVPLDPDYPPARLAAMLADCAPALLLGTRDGLHALALAAVDVPALSFDTRAEPGEEDVETDPHRDGHGPANLAYVIYTSGSTGRPKGVMVEQRSVVHLWTALEAAIYAPCAPDARIGLNAALSFDASLQALTQLLSGRCVVVIPQVVRSDPAAMCAFLAEARIDALDCTPSQLALLVHHGLLADGARAPDTIVVGGEALSPALWDALAASSRRCFNVYGPTECTVDATCARIEGVGRAPHIGWPLGDTVVRVLDADGRDVAAGETGEIFLGGVQLARGYLGRDDLTAERFVADPRGGGRLYRSGDLGRWNADGSLAYLGRNDAQVKLRGHRIEPGEIEAQLCALPGVREAVVIVREDRPGDARLVGYYVSDAGDGDQPSAAALRSALQAQLPEQMVPAALLRLDALPLTPSGKRDVAALPAPGGERPELDVAFEPPVGAVEARLCDAFAALLGIAPVGRHDNFFALGGNSLLAARLLEGLRAHPDAAAPDWHAMPVMQLFQHPTPASLAAAVAASASAGARAGVDAARLSRGTTGNDAAAAHEPIAIVAMAGRFPGARDVEAFWQNLLDGRESITRFADGDLDASIAGAERRASSYVAARGVIDDVELFDAAFFGIAPREAELMDPQQRLLLELCWECMERAGHVPGGADAGVVGVFAGMNNATYLQRNVAAHPDLVEKLGAFQVMLGSEKDYLATRVAHRLDLTGPAVAVQTACSTSLVAICQAVDSLRAGQCDMALAGAASVVCPPRSGYHHQEGSMLSPDGHTRTFDAAAAGTVFGDGAAVVLLKRLSDARADGDTVIALVRGGAINNDGGRKASFTAPSSEGQAAVIAMAQRNAGVDARSIGYIEAHGTATPLGDPIEIEGLTRAFRAGTDDVGFCRVGSVKSNVGHLVAAAGVAGVIKTALALHARFLPATLHVQATNPAIDFAGSPFVVSAQRVDWPVPAAGWPRRAGVSSFGVGGTNAHLVMEEAATTPASTPDASPQLLVLSARSPAALAKAATRLADHLETASDVSLADVAWTLAVGRKAFAHRVAVVATDLADACTRLRALDTAAAISRSRPVREIPTVLLFPGQGTQYAGMGRALHAVEPAFHEAFDACMTALDDAARVHGGVPDGATLRALVFGDDAQALLPTGVMQPALFAIEYATARLWMQHGVQPAAMIGHSIGEYVAATLAGVFSLADAMRLVARRGALMQAQPVGAMLSVRLPLAALQARLPAELSIAAENGPAACVVSGPTDAIAMLETALAADGIACRALQTSHAFHSAMMDGVVGPFRTELARTALHAPSLPIVSTVSRDWLRDDEATSPDYWANQLRAPVRFDAALSRVLGDGARVLLEAGPRATLSGLVTRRVARDAAGSVAIASLGDVAGDELATFRKAAGQLWCRGALARVDRFDQRAVRRRVRLPTYPFERQRHWVEARPASAAAVVAAAPGASPTRQVSASSPSAPAPATAVPTCGQETAMNLESTVPHAAPPADRQPRLLARLRGVLEDVAGIDLDDADADAHFIELGLDSLTLTQVALQLQSTFGVRIAFRQLMADVSSLRALAAHLDAAMPPDAAQSATATVPAGTTTVHAAPFAGLALAPLSLASATHGATQAAGGDALLREVIAQQMQVMAQQLALLAAAGHGAGNSAAPGSTPVSPPVPAAEALAAWTGESAAPVAESTVDAPDTAEAAPQARYDVQKAFGAIARIHSGRTELDARQQARLQAFIARYVARTPQSKAYTQQHRAHMADPRVVSGFRPLWKEIVYQTVIARSKGAHLTDIDGNDYVDANNGFGMSLFGWQPGFVLDAVRAQLELGYEIGPQHPLAGEVCALVCELTGHDRAGLCNTGSEAVLGALRVARTVTGRRLVAVFNGSYHGINDEVVVRGNKRGQAMPGAPGILRAAVDNVLVLDYGTPEALQVLRERAGELAAVLVEPVQSRRPDLQPVDFLRELRAITAAAGTVLIFDEVITGFRAHLGGTQALWGIRADLATYGKVIGGGYPLGVIAGKRDYMDALDGGHWQYGDDSAPTVGVTYFAGTFVRHPLALAATKAVLEHLKHDGGALQAALGVSTTALADELNAFCRAHGAPIEIRHFASLWRTHWLEEHPLQDLLFAMIRSRGVHILDNFPCYLTTAHSAADIASIVQAYKDSVLELQECGFLPRHAANARTVMDASQPPAPGARIGRDVDGRPAWFVADDAAPGRYRQVAG